jgi:hypothetical protein
MDNSNKNKSINNIKQNKIATRLIRGSKVSYHVTATKKTFASTSKGIGAKY